MTVQGGSGQMFDGIAKRYDLLNGITSMGQDRRWRRHAVRALQPNDGVVLDLAAGTCDVARAILQRHKATRVVAVDPSREMLRQGQEKLARAGLGRRALALVAGGEALPLSNTSVTGATIAFGIRNFTDRTVALRDLHRVLQPGGRLVILELTLPRHGIMGPFARFYVQRVIPAIGGLLSGKGAYAYLPRSMEAFPSPHDFSQEMRQAGFDVVLQRAFMFGSCHMFVGERKGDV